MPPSFHSLPLLDTLLGLSPVRAVLWLDEKGAVKARSGQARAIKSDADEPTTMNSLKKLTSGKEAVYIRRFRDTDYLVIIFDEDTDFDSLKQKIDALSDSP